MWATRVLDRQSLKGAISLLLFFFPKPKMNYFKQKAGWMFVLKHIFSMK